VIVWCLLAYSPLSKSAAIVGFSNLFGDLAKRLSVQLGVTVAEGLLKVPWRATVR
jgi:hypothetical protein